MHIPDGFLSPATCAACGLIVIPFWIVGWNKMQASLKSGHAIQSGMMACFVFLVQMFNIPLPGGTTAHAVGAALVAIVCGPWVAIIAVSISLAVQAIVFGDGGIMAFGANTLNMAVVQAVVAWTVWKLMQPTTSGDPTSSMRRQTVPAFVAGYLAIVIGAALTGLELGIQPHLFADPAGMPEYFPMGLKITLPAMVIPHLLIGLVEGGVTAGAVSVLFRMPEHKAYDESSPSLKPPPSPIRFAMILAAMLILVPLGVLLPSWAGSGTAWGEWSAGETARRANLTQVPPGMSRNADSWNAPVSDYAFRKPVEPLDQSTQYMGAALLGMFLTGGCFILLHKKRISRNQKEQA
jgi:cobalt/nickel transport system permease protein